MADLMIAEVQEAVARCVPDRDCVVQSGRRLSYQAFPARTRLLASYLRQHDLGCHR